MIEFNLSLGQGIIAFTNGQRVDLRWLDDRIWQAGFQLRWIDLAVVGTLKKSPAAESGLSLQVASTGQEIFLRPGNTDKEQIAFASVAQLAGEPALRLYLRGRTQTKERLAMSILQWERRN